MAICIVRGVTDRSIATNIIFIISSKSSSTSNVSVPRAGVDDVQQPSLEKCATAYVAGYLIYKNLKKNKCQLCHVQLSDNDIERLTNPTDLMIVFKDYGKNETIEYLQKPSDEFVTIVTTILKVFKKFYDKMACSKGILGKILHESVKVINKNYKNWLQLNGCAKHKLFLIKFVLQTMLSKKLLWKSDEIQAPINRKSSSKTKKLNILANK